MPYCADNLSTAGRESLLTLLAAFRLSSSYEGPILQLRRPSDGSLQDVYVDANDSYRVGSSSSPSAQLVSDWLAPDVFGYLTVVYDQSGNQKNAVQTDTSLQPKFNPADGFLDFKGGYFYMLMDVTSFDSGNSPYTWVVKHGQINNVYGGLFGIGNTAKDQSLCMRREHGLNHEYWWANDCDLGSYAAGNVLAVTYDQTKRRGYVNGMLKATINSLNHALVAQNAFLGNTIYRRVDESLKGELFYLITSRMALSDSDRQALEHCVICSEGRCVAGKLYVLLLLCYRSVLMELL